MGNQNAPNAIMHLAARLFIIVATLMATSIPAQGYDEKCYQYTFCIMDNVTVYDEYVENLIREGRLDNSENYWDSRDYEQIKIYQQTKTSCVILTVNVVDWPWYDGYRGVPLDHTFYYCRLNGMHIGGSTTSYIVIQAPDGISVTNKPEIMRAGEEITLRETLTGTYPSFQGSGYFSYERTSSDPTVADFNGTSSTLTAKSPGTTKITIKVYAKNSKYSGSYYIGSTSFDVTVKGNEPEEYVDVLIDGIYYKFDTATRTASVSGRKNKTEADLTIPQNVSYLNHEYTVTEISDNAFLGNKDMVSVKLPSTLTRIGKHAFHGCTTLASVSLPDKLEMIGGYAFCGCKGMESVTFGSGLKEIGEYAFYSCSLTYADLPDQLEIIGKWAFACCPDLESIVIGSGLRTLDVYAFYLCPRLSYIYVSDKNQYFKTVDGILLSKNGKDVYKVPETMSDVSLPESVEILRNGCFSNNELIEHVDLPQGLKAIYACAFEDCTNLQTVHIPDNVESILNSAFRRTSSVKSIEIGQNVSEIGPEVFATGSNYSEVYVRAVLPPKIEEDTFDNYGATLYVPMGRRQAYANADHWKNFKTVKEYDPAAGIEEISADGEKGNTGVYNLGGVLIKQAATPEDIETLTPGIYIIGGKKIIIN